MTIPISVVTNSGASLALSIDISGIVEDSFLKVVFMNYEETLKVQVWMRFKPPEVNPISPLDSPVESVSPSPSKL